MSSPNEGPRAPAAPLDSLSDASPAQAPGAGWLDASVERARPRQAAITRNLHTWSNYQSWTEQVLGSWESSAGGEAGIGPLPEAASKE